MEVFSGTCGLGGTCDFNFDFWSMDCFGFGIGIGSKGTRLGTRA